MLVLVLVLAHDPPPGCCDARRPARGWSTGALRSVAQPQHPGAGAGRDVLAAAKRAPGGRGGAEAHAGHALRGGGDAGFGAVCAVRAAAPRGGAVVLARGAGACNRTLRGRWGGSFSPSAYPADALGLGFACVVAHVAVTSLSSKTARGPVAACGLSTFVGMAVYIGACVALL
jgi:hypothetical protein